MTKKICLSLIVKDEASNVVSLLNSLKHIIDYCLVIDTGSTDGTLAEYQRVCQEINIPLVTVETSFFDFSHARNRALEETRKLDVDYILIMDGDDLFCGDIDKDTLTRPAYYITVKYGDLIVKRVSLIAKNSKFYYKGAVHEYLTAPTRGERASIEINNDILLPDCHISANHDEILTKAQTDAKNTFYLKLLYCELDSLKNNISDLSHVARLYFYIGLTEMNLANYNYAITALEKCKQLTRWDEERYVASLLLTKCAIAINNIKSAYSYAMDGWLLRPHRVETIYYLAKYFRELGLYGLAAPLLLPYVDNITFPQDDILFVEEDVYAYKCMDEFVISAYYYEPTKKKGKQIMRKLLKLLPGLPISEKEKARIKDNSKFYK
jgi:glycosyltransferase involved in cell wall biosynthesis